MFHGIPGKWCGIWVLVAGWLAVSCTGTGAAPRAEMEVLPTPTILTARFTPVAGQINEESLKQAATSAAPAEAPAVDLELGQRVYGNLCAQCHGADLQGTEQGGALTVWDMSQDEFVVLLRTGGELGNQHLFGTTKVSQTGIAALWGYLQSIADS